MSSIITAPVQRRKRARGVALALAAVLSVGLATPAVAQGATQQTSAAQVPVWTQTGNTKLAGTAESGVLKGPDRGVRWELSFNVKDLSDTWDAKEKHDPLAQLATAKQKWGSDPQVTQLYFYLWDYYNTPIPQEGLDNMQRVFDALRNEGVHVVLRFAIDDGVRPNRPYTVDNITSLINQVAPVVKKNADVVSVWQAGFVGAWGEWGPNIYGHQNYPEAVTKIMKTLVSQLPDGVRTQMRYPWLREAISDLPTRAMVGYANDYFTLGGGAYDFYVPQDGRYSGVLANAPYQFVDGEMPWDSGQSLDPAAWNTVIPWDQAASRLQSMHYSTFSASHNATVTYPGWQKTQVTQAQVKALRLPYDPAYFTDENGAPRTRTAYEYIRDHLGYRLAATEVAAGSTDGNKLDVRVDLANYGFAAVQKSYPVTVDVLDGNKRVVASSVVNVDPREWAAAPAVELTSTPAVAPRVSLRTQVDVQNVADGTYSIALTIGNRTQQGGALQLANDGKTTTFVDGRNILTQVSRATPVAKVSVTFDANGHGTAPAPQQIDSGAKAAVPAEPTSKGFIFGGWFTDASGTTPYDFTAPVTANTTIYAKWTEDLAQAVSTLTMTLSATTVKQGGSLTLSVEGFRSDGSSLGDVTSA